MADKKHSNSFPPEQRLRKSRDFKELQRVGVKKITPHFVMYSHRSARGVSKIGITVSTKVSSRSVDRNRVKRHVREFFRTEKTKFKYPLELVVIARQDAQTLTSQQMRAELARALKIEG